MAYQDNLQRYFGELARYGEPALTAGSSAIAEPISGLIGLGYTLAGQGNNAAVNAINKTQQAMTYQPRTAEGLQGLQGLQDFLQPVGDIVQGASQKLGDKAYSATGSPSLAAAAYSAPTALLEGLGLKGLGIARKPVSGADLHSPKMGIGEVGEVGDDFVIVTHATSDPNFTGEIRKGGLGNIFDGVFASYGDTSNYGGIKEIRYEVPKNKIMSSGDLDVDYDKAMSFIRDKFDDLPDDDADAIYDIVAGDKNIYSLDKNPFENYGYDDLGEASWFGQKLRGELAKKLGFDAVEMSDEFGTSILIPYGSGAKIKNSQN